MEQRFNLQTSCGVQTDPAPADEFLNVSSAPVSTICKQSIWAFSKCLLVWVFHPAISETNGLYFLSSFEHHMQNLELVLEALNKKHSSCLMLFLVSATVEMLTPVK